MMLFKKERNNRMAGPPKTTDIIAVRIGRSEFQANNFAERPE